MSLQNEKRDQIVKEAMSCRVQLLAFARSLVGEYAGMFRGDLHRAQPLSKIDESGRFEAVYNMSQFTIEPVVLDRHVEGAASPVGLLLDGVWAFTHTKRLVGTGDC